MPGAEQEAEWTPTLPQADVLERRQLVDGGNSQGHPRDPATGAIPCEQVTRDASAGGRTCKGNHSDARPRDEIAGSEKERCDRRAALCHARVERDRRRYGRKHHRRHHHDPHSDKPGERPEIRPRPTVHALHLVDRPPPAHCGESEEERDEPEPGTRGGEGGRESAGARSAFVCRGDQALRRPTRTRRSTVPTYPRT